MKDGKSSWEAQAACPGWCSLHPSLVLTVHTSYLSSPANTLPDTEIHKDPGDGQGDGQRPADLTRLIQPVRHLMHVTPDGTGGR